MSQQLSSPAQTETSGNAGSADGSPVSRLKADLLAIVVLAGINIICFSNTLGCYFYADDFLHISYLHKLLQEHPETLLLNLNTPWQDPGIGMFVRPVIELSLALDYVIWKGSALGYHLTNLFYQIVSTFCVFGITKRMLKGFASRQAWTASLMCAAVFAAFPLHGEVVAWTLGRTDGLCGLFYLAAFWLFLKGYQDEKKAALTASLVCFTLSLLSKEMAVSLPLVVALYILMFGREAGAGLKPSFIAALRGSALYWIVLLAYLALRTILLSTFMGGYVTSFGDNLYSNFVSRVFYPATLLRLFLPINRDLVSLHGTLSNLLHLVYMLCGISILVRAVRQPWDQAQARVMLFLSGAFLLSALPAFQVWHIAPELTGSRYTYIPGALLCILFTLLIFPFDGNQPSLPVRLPNWFKPLSLGILAFTVIVFGAVSYRNNDAFVNAGRQVLAIQKSVLEAAAKLPDGQRLLILNLAQDCQGAHMFYSFEMFRNLFKPPFSPVDITDRLGSFEPRFLADKNLLNKSRLSEMAHSGKYSFFFWDRANLKLIPVARQAVANGALGTTGDTVGFTFTGKYPVTVDGVRTAWHAYRVDKPEQAPGCEFVAVTAVAPRPDGWQPPWSRPDLFLAWHPVHEELFGENEPLPLKLYQDGEPHIYIFKTGEHKFWSLCDRIDQVSVYLPTDSPSARILSVRSLPGKNFVPTLQADDRMKDNGEGLHLVAGDQADFSYDASLIPQAEAAYVEVSKCYHQFEQTNGTFRESKLSKGKLAGSILEELKSTFSVPLQLLPKEGWYQVRVAATDGEGQVLGYFSDPVDIKVTAEQIRRARGK